MKDRPALHMIKRARERGDLRPGGMIDLNLPGGRGGVHEHDIQIKVEQMRH